MLPQLSVNSRCLVKTYTVLQNTESNPVGNLPDIKQKSTGTEKFNCSRVCVCANLSERMPCKYRIMYVHNLLSLCKDMNKTNLTSVL